ncbi:MAG: nucleotide pyrophosphohydrolase [Planctomycetota bacterium]|nr:nucleotide pyrophosphohydrolase [Planctomycetota bacterium]
MADSQTTVLDLRKKMAGFVAARDWEQFHDPKNLAMALCAEAAELLEHFLWITPENSKLSVLDPTKRREVSEEIADVTCLIMALCNCMNLDLSDSLNAKMLKNELKYPAEKCRGSYKAPDAKPSNE